MEISRVLLIVCLLGLAIAGAQPNYPLYKQCDSSWANDQLGTSSKTICQAGCLMSSVAMALKGHGVSENPHTLNIWLKNNGGYASGNLYVWASINKRGFTFKGFVGNSEIKKNIDAGHVVILNVHNGGHWVLAKGYSGDNIQVNDPGYSSTSYPLSGIVNGNTGVYTTSKMPEVVSRITYAVETFFRDLLGFPPAPQTPTVEVVREDRPANLVQE